MNGAIVEGLSFFLFGRSYGENTLDLEHDLMDEMELPLPPSADVMDLWAQREQPVDSFRLTHHDLDICTNSLQYEMLFDVINNLLLYVEPHRKVLHRPPLSTGA